MVAWRFWSILHLDLKSQILDLRFEISGVGEILFWVSLILTALAALLLLPVAVLCAECLAALLPGKRLERSGTPASPRPTVAVLIPAHNEEELLADTLRSLLPQLEFDDRVEGGEDEADPKQNLSDS